MKLSSAGAGVLFGLVIGVGLGLADPPPDLTQLSLDDLMNIEVTTVSKKPEKSSQAAAALYVITAEDIERAGFDRIPDALRLAPGVHVAAIDSSKTVVSVRGFSSQLSNKLLVLMDGRNVYTPLFGGVFWDAQDTMLEDIDRIEVIRGPGGTLWGANAVNGVINVITKSARDTQGGLLVAEGGSEEHGLGAVRYGSKIGEDLYFRAYAKYFNRDGGFLEDQDENDDWQVGRTGFRTDWYGAAPRVHFTLQGDYYEGREGPFGGPQSPDVGSVLQGGNLLARLTRDFAGGSEVALQSYYDYTYRNDLFFRERRNTWDLDLQHRVPLPAHQDLVWGLDYRVSDDHLHTTPALLVERDGRNVQLYSAFVQDEVSLAEGAVKLTGGVKVEHNDFTGFEFQPSGRIAWSPITQHTAWASVSRAVRTLTRIENDLSSTLDPSVGALSRYVGNRQATSEKLLAYEAGYRFPVREQLFLDLTAFYNDYRDVLTFSPQTPGFDPSNPGIPVVPVLIANHLDGQIYGFEIAADAQLADFWRVRGSYSHLQLEMRPRPGDLDPQSAEGASPVNQFSLRSIVNLPGGAELDAFFRYVDSLPSQDVPAYFSLDVRLARRFARRLEVALVGQNLLSPHHSEFSGGTDVERAAYGKISWSF